MDTSPSYSLILPNNDTLPSVQVPKRKCRENKKYNLPVTFEKIRAVNTTVYQLHRESKKENDIDLLFSTKPLQASKQACKAGAIHGGVAKIRFLI